MRLLRSLPAAGALLAAAFAVSCVTLVASVALAPPAAAAEDLQSLLGRLTDTEHWPRSLRPGERVHRFSSTDPASRAAQPGTDGWFANDDKGHFLRTLDGPRGKEYVLAEAEGPGAVAHVWAAKPSGTLRVYLDGADSPILEESMEALLSGAVKWCPPPLAERRSLGANLHLPIPFAKSVRITCSAPDLYYGVSVVQFPASTHVASLTRSLLHSSAGVIAAAAKRLTAREDGTAFDHTKTRDGSRTLYLHGVAPDGERPPFLTASPYQTALFEIESPAGQRSTITELALTEFASNDADRALERVLLVIAFDDEETVRVPLGAFFGCGPRGGEHRSVPAGLAKEVSGWRLYSRFPMPFDHTAKITLENRSGADLAGRLTWRVREARADETLRFGAVYRESLGLATRPRRDLTLCDLRGAGRVVGVSLSVNNPVPQWWGEGDEKITVDGEPFPSWFGTGTEDYFNDAWSSGKVYSHTLHGQPVHDGAQHQGLATRVRWHLADAIPFTRSLRFDLGIWHHADTRLDLASTVFYYATPQTTTAAPFPRSDTPRFGLAPPR